MTTNFSILASAKALPTTKVTNQELTQLMATSDDWIKQRTGIRSRHVATDETTTSLAASVAQQLLQQSRLAATAIDLIIVATMSPVSYTHLTLPTICSV